jgi:hypothetical protein
VGRADLIHKHILLILKLWVESKVLLHRTLFIGVNAAFLLWGDCFRSGIDIYGRNCLVK